MAALRAAASVVRSRGLAAANGLGQDLCLERGVARQGDLDPLRDGGQIEGLIAGTHSVAVDQNIGVRGSITNRTSPNSGDNVTLR